MTSSQPTVAFFGATGDCAGFCLAAALKAGHTCSALARTPSKLEASLSAKGVSADALSRLSIVQGDARNEDDVRKALLINGKLVDIVISGIGSLPALQWSLTRPVTLKDPSICADAATTLVKALNSISSVERPLVVVLSTTGISPASKPRDIPLAYTWLYKQLLHVPHMDKANMEAIIAQADGKTIRSHVAVKPTLLMDGAAIGLDKIRAGTEDEPAIGYTIRRADVGEWMYANLIAKQPPTSWLGKGVCLTS